MNLLSDLNQFCGSEEWYHGITKKVIYSEGVKYLATKAKCYWLIDAITSHILLNKNMRIALLGENLHFWKLKKTNGGAMLRAIKDKGEKSFCSQQIPYTDFPFDELGNEFVLCVGNDGPGTPWKIFLPSEH